MAWARTTCSISTSFARFATHWVDPLLDRGPFVLVHGDFELYNLLLNDRIEVILVLDWEWSHSGNGVSRYLS